jgi:hypothetical protein
MSTRIYFFDVNNRLLFEVTFLHQGNSHWTIGQVLSAVRSRFERLGLDVDNLNFTINGREYYNDRNLVTSFDMGGRINIRVGVDELPTSAPRLVRENAANPLHHPLPRFRGSTKRRKNKSRRKINMK